MKDWMPRFKKQKEFFDKAIIEVDSKGKNRTWPYLPSGAETAYLNWVKEVTDPVTGEPYLGKKEVYKVDNNGKETKELVTNLPQEQRIVAIQRNKTSSGEEFLLSKGVIIGYNEFGDETPYTYEFMEMYIEQKFNQKRGIDQKTNKMRYFMQGPSFSIIHYTMRWTPENVDKLWKLRDPNNRCSLVIKDELSGRAKEARDINDFRDKSFDFIMNMEWASEDYKKQKLEEYSALMEKKKPAMSK